jgi:hypothetical protein
VNDSPPSLLSTSHTAPIVSRLRHRYGGFGMQSGTGIYNIEMGRASALAADGIAGDCFASAGEHTAMIVGRCMFIGGLLAGYVLVELAVPVHVRYGHLYRVAG